MGGLPLAQQHHPSVLVINQGLGVYRDVLRSLSFAAYYNKLCSLVADRLHFKTHFPGTLIIFQYEILVRVTETILCTTPHSAAQERWG